MKFKVGESVKIKDDNSPYVPHRGKIGTIVERSERLTKTGIEEKYRVEIEGCGEWSYAKWCLKRLTK